jgi:hypothetical protein
VKFQERFVVSRININIAIVDMISVEFRGKGAVMSECVGFTNASNVTFYEVKGEEVREYVSMERRFLDYIGVSGSYFSWCQVPHWLISQTRRASIQLKPT